MTDLRQRVARREREARCRIGFVPVIRPLFKGDSPTAAAVSRAALERLGASEGFDVIVPSVASGTVHAETGEPVPVYAVTDAAEAQRAAAELADAELDFLLIQHTSFATGDLLAPLVNAHRRVGVWALPEAAGGRGASGPLPLNSLCGLNMTLSLLDTDEVEKREPVKWFYGDADDDWFLERLRTTLGALGGLRSLETARVLQIGGTAPAFWGLEELPEALPGVEVETMPLAALFAEVETVPESAARALAADWMREAYDASEEHLVRGARIELALGSLAESAAADALAVRCWPELPDACGAMACAAMGNTAGSLMPAACEGDVMGALSMLALQGVTAESAILMDLSDLDRKDDSLLVWHCGNAPLRWSAEGQPARLTTHFNRDGVGVVRDMVVRPGPTTGFRLLGGGRKALILSGRFGSPQKESFDGVRGWLYDLRWNLDPRSAAQVVSGILDQRLPHHVAFGMGERTLALRELCAWLGAEPAAAPAEPDPPIPAAKP